MILKTSPTLNISVDDNTWKIERKAMMMASTSVTEFKLGEEFTEKMMSGLETKVTLIMTSRGHSGIWGWDSQFRGGGERVGGGYSFLGERVWGGYHFFELGITKLLSIKLFGALSGQRRHKNAQKSLKAAVWDHFELILVTFSYFFAIFAFFRRYCLFFLLTGEFFERVGGVFHFLRGPP
jgi:hypothetical protein